MTVGRNNITSITPTATATATATTKLNSQAALSIPSKECCSNCGGAHAGPLLHHVRLHDTPRRLCTSCVLRLHPTSFCPACLDFYGDSLPLPSKRVPCSNCSSSTHSHCAGDSLLSSYLCPPCKDPSFSFFTPKDNKIDKKLALALLCASKIASSSIGKAVSEAWANADEKTKEAALARKRAREALEDLLEVTREEKARNEENENAELLDANLAKVEDLDMDNADADDDIDADVDADADADADEDIDADLVRQLEDSLVKDEDID